MKRETMCWGVLCASDCRLDGKRQWLAGTPNYTTGTQLFPTREQARKHIEERYGYIRRRADLAAEPHGWKMPRAIKVRVIVEMIQ